MTTDEIISFVDGLDGVLTFRPGPEDGAPEVAWGDTFFYYAPDGVLPSTGQPFATIVTKDYPDDAGSRLDRPDAFRVNVAAGREAFRTHTGRDPGEVGDRTDRRPSPDPDDTVLAHPVYGAQGWLCVTNPGPAAGATTRELLEQAHGLAASRFERRATL